MGNTKEVDLQRGPYRTTYVGMEVTRKSTKKEWKDYGTALQKIDEVRQWAIGDWLADGKRHYGDGLYKKAAEIMGVDNNYLRQMKSLSERFELLNRFNNPYSPCLRGPHP